jgi:hypothetical protein
MLKTDITDILDAARSQGWVVEPEALRLLAAAGIPVPRFAWARSRTDTLASAAAIGYPVVAKVVSPEIMHKSDVHGVVTAIRGPERLSEVYEQFSRQPAFAGVIVAETLAGCELIVGAKIDYQFGPVVLLGIGGTGVEIYQDTVIRMAPLREHDVPSMLGCLRGNRLLTGHRGQAGVSIPKLTEMMLRFSALVMDLGDRIDSVDLNPVFCSAERCVAADARIILAHPPG